MAYEILSNGELTLIKGLEFFQIMTVEALVNALSTIQQKPAQLEGGFFLISRKTRWIIEAILIEDIQNIHQGEFLNAVTSTRQRALACCFLLRLYEDLTGT